MNPKTFNSSPSGSALAALMILILSCHAVAADREPRVVHLPPQYIVNGLSRLNIGGATGSMDLEAVATKHYDAVVAGNERPDSEGASTPVIPRGKLKHWFCVRGYKTGPDVRAVVIIYEDDKGGQITVDKWTRGAHGKWVVSPYFK